MVASVDLNSGAVTPVVKGLSFAIDALEIEAGYRSAILILEYSTDLLTGAPGRLLLYDGKTTKVLAAGLTTPSSMDFDPRSGSVFITNRNDGQIIRVHLPF